MNTAPRLVVNNLPDSMVGHLEPVHSDARRAIREYNGIDYSIQHFVIGTERSALGNHYHTGKSETFTILEGGGTLVMRAVDAMGVPCGGLFKTEVKKGDVIRVNPFMAHTFILDPGTEMLNYSSAPFDPLRPDITQHTLVDPRTQTIVVD